MMVPEEDAELRAVHDYKEDLTGSANDNMKISVVEFTHMQQQLCALKAEKYEASDRESRLIAQLEALRATDAKKALLADLQVQNARLSKDALQAMEDHMETQERLNELQILMTDQKVAWKASISQLSEEVEALKAQLQKYQDAALHDDESDTEPQNASDLAQLPWFQERQSSTASLLSQESTKDKPDKQDMVPGSQNSCSPIENCNGSMSDSNTASPASSTPNNIQDELALLQAKNSRLQRKLFLLKQASQDKIDRLEAQLAHHQDAASRIAGQVGRENKRLSEALHERQQQYQVQLENLKSQDNSREQRRLLESEILRLNQVVEESLAEESRITAEAKQLTSKAAEEQQRQEEISKELAKSADEVVALRSENERLTEQLKEKTEHANSVEEKNEAIRSAYLEERKDLESNLESLQMELMLLSKKAVLAQDRADSQAYKLEMCESELNDLRRQTLSMQPLQAAQSRLQNEIATLNASLEAERTQHEAVLSQERLDHQEQLALLEKELENVRFLHTALKGKLEQSERARLESEAKAMEDQAILQTQIDQLTADMATMTTAAAEVEKEHKKMTCKLEESASEVSQLQRTLETERQERSRQEWKTSLTVKDLRRQLSHSVATQLPNHAGESLGEGMRRSSDGLATEPREGRLSSSLSKRENSSQTAQNQRALDEMQALLNKREEKIKFFEQHVRELTESLAKKQAMIQVYMAQQARQDGPTQSGKEKKPPLGSVSIAKPGTDPAMLEDINRKLQAMLEDLLMKNMNLEEKIKHKAARKARRKEKKQLEEAENAAQDNTESHKTDIKAGGQDDQQDG